MYIVKAKSKKGGFWDAKNQKLSREFKTKDKSIADDYKSKGFEVVEEKKSSADGEKVDK